MSSDENSWIRCDDCHCWVMTGCDNITDINLYDDANPNYLHYSCPNCRKKSFGVFPQHYLNRAGNCFLIAKLILNSFEWER